MHSKTRDRVFNWWELEQRDFPWRRTRDPWAILVSEFMLQQTQAQRVISKYEMFWIVILTSMLVAKVRSAK